MLEEEDEDAGTTLELPFLETELGSQELDQALVIRQEEFVEVDRRDNLTEEELKDKKVAAKNVNIAIEMLPFFVSACVVHFCTTAVRLYFSLIF